MNLTDNNLTELFATLNPLEKVMLANALREGATMTDDCRAVLRWLRRRLKRRVRAKREKRIHANPRRKAGH